MECSPPMSSLQEASFRMYISNLLCSVKNLPPFTGEDKEQKRRDLLNDFDLRVRDIFGNKKFLNDEGRAGRYVILGKKSEMIQFFCDQIINILFDRRNDLKNLKINGQDDYFLFLDEICKFFLSEKNLPSFINLIFSLVSGGSIFRKEGDYEKDREWLDSFEFKA